jgi:hypothetical protein
MHTDICTFFFSALTPNTLTPVTPPRPVETHAHSSSAHADQFSSDARLRRMCFRVSALLVFTAVLAVGVASWPIGLGSGPSKPKSIGGNCGCCVEVVVEGGDVACRVKGSFRVGAGLP